jgi:predicted ATPase/DNA-binding winged helix-turn-helix (wHTH) protein
MGERGYQCGAFTIDVDDRQFLRDGQALAIEPKVFAVIAALVARHGHLLSRDELLDAVWGHRFVTPSTLSRTVALARRAFGDDAGEPSYIQTVHGAGYRFVAACTPLAAETASPRFGPPFALRLPERVEPLVGRGDELATLRRLVETHRGVTVLGPGGIGKTQCALEVARQTAASFADGTWFFDLSSSERAADWLDRLAEALGIPPGAAGSAVPAIAEVLRERRALLVVDNCEQFAGELASTVVQLLRATTHVVVVATSRRALDFAGEQRFVLPTLRVPEATDGVPPTLAEVSGCEAVELLVRRVRAVRADFTLDAHNAQAMADICRALDGMPLALELAAARFSLLSAEQVLGRLVERFRFLESDTAGRPRRHRSLRELLDWSHDLLSPKEQRLLAWSAVFMQSWSIDALIALAAPMGLDADAAIDHLSGLIAHSLVSVVHGATPVRYRLLETVREFALARLRERGEEGPARLAHLAAMAAVCEEAHQAVQRGRMREGVQQLILDRANVDAAVETAATDAAGADAGLRLIGALLLLTKAQANFADAWRWSRRVLEAPRAAASPYRARALLTLGVMQVYLFTAAPAAPDALQDAIRLAAASGDRWTQSYAHAYQAMSLANGGAAAGLAEAAGHAARAAELARDLADDLLDGRACLANAWVHFARGDPAAALDALGHAPATCSDRHQQHFIEMYRALAHHLLGESPNAARHWLSAFEYVTGLANIRGVAGSIEGCAYLACAAGKLATSARLLAAAETIRERAGAPIFRSWLAPQAVVRRRLDEALGMAEWTALRDAGRQARYEDIVAEAVDFLQSMANPGSA